MCKPCAFASANRATNRSTRIGNWHCAACVAFVKSGNIWPRRNDGGLLMPKRNLTSSPPPIIIMWVWSGNPSKRWSRLIPMEPFNKTRHSCFPIIITWVREASSIRGAAKRLHKRSSIIWCAAMNWHATMVMCFGKPMPCKPSASFWSTLPIANSLFATTFLSFSTSTSTTCPTRFWQATWRNVHSTCFGSLAMSIK